MRTRVVILALTLLAGACAKKKAAPEPPPAPCVPRTQFTATGFFHVEQDCGAPLLVDADGKPFFSFGVNHVGWEGDSAKDGTNPYNEAVSARYGTEDAWAQATAQRMAEWGWNTSGAWSSDSMGKLIPYTPILTLSGADWISGKLPDYFDPAWEASVQMKAASGTAGRTQDRLLIGYFIDNEMHWGPDWRVNTDPFDEYLARDATTPGKQALVGLLHDAHQGDIASLNAAWHTSFGSWDEVAGATVLGPRGTSAAADSDRSAFITLAARRFFTVTAGAIRANDPNHLVLGVRFVASFVPIEVAKAAAEFCDVISANDYEFVTDPQMIYPPDQFNMVNLNTDQPLADFYQITGKPILISEFGWRAKDSGLPNTWPPIYPTLDTQTDRADHFEHFARSLLAAPWIVGYHWFEYTDEPAQGRFDGENDNWGLVDSADDPYTVVTTRTAAVNHWTAP